MLGCQSTSKLSAVNAPPTHMLRLECVDESLPGSLSRIAVLATDNLKCDFAVVSGHAIPKNRPCLVKDFFGNDSKVDAIRLADDYKSGTKSDWAFIKFEKIETPNLTRYDLVPFTLPQPFKNMEIRFAGARGIQENSQICQLGTS